MIIKKTPTSYKDTIVYQEIDRRKNVDLQDKLDVFVEHISPLLNIINTGPFREYTLHNDQHSKKLLHLAGFIIPKDVLMSLSDLELVVMSMSFYLHDAGMVLTETEKQRVVDSDGFRRFLNKKGYAERINQIKEGDSSEESKRLLESQVIEVALASYIRPNHACIERYRSIISRVAESSNRSDLFESGGVSFEEELLKICKTHNDPATELLALKPRSMDPEYPVHQIIDGFSLNSQYIASVLRIVDVLDFDRERTPRSLFNALEIEKRNLPGFNVSLREWNKQISVHSLELSDRQLTVSADSNSPSIERSIREYCSYMEREFRDTLGVLSRNRQERDGCSYSLDVPLVVKAKIRPLDYSFKDYSIRLNDQKIIELLMGENLYSHMFTAARELLQNSLDACALKQSIDPSYSPAIELSFYTDEEKRLWMKVDDNGIGMDNYVLEHFFFKIGSSYYRSMEFRDYSEKKRISSFVPISRFGIGILSVFMIGDFLKVRTCNMDSDNGDYLERELFLRDAHSLAIVKEKSEGSQGTTIEVRLKSSSESPDDYSRKIIQYVKEMFIRPAVPVGVRDLSGNRIIISKASFLQLKKEMYSEIEKTTAKVVSIDLERFSRIIEGRVYFIFFRKKDGTLSYYDEDGRYSWGVYPFKEERLFDAKQINLVTVNGIRMTAKKTGSLYNFRKHNVVMVVDVDVSGNEKIIYDVSRNKISGQGLTFLEKN